MSRGRRTTRGPGAAAVASIALATSTLLSACVSGGDATRADTSAPEASVSSADAARFDWSAIVAELDRRRAEAQRDPSIEAVDTFCAPVSECYEQWSDSIGYLVDNDLRMVGGQPDEIVDVAYAGTLDGSPLSEAFEVVLDVERVATEQGVVRLVDGSGAVEQEFRPDDDTPPGTTVFEAIVLQRQTLTSEWLVFETG